MGIRRDAYVSPISSLFAYQLELRSNHHSKRINSLQVELIRLKITRMNSAHAPENGIFLPTPSRAPRAGRLTKALSEIATRRAQSLDDNAAVGRWSGKKPAVAFINTSPDARHWRILQEEIRRDWQRCLVRLRRKMAGNSTTLLTENDTVERDKSEMEVLTKDGRALESVDRKGRGCFSGILVLINGGGMCSVMPLTFPKSIHRVHLPPCLLVCIPVSVPFQTGWRPRVRNFARDTFVGCSYGI